MGKLTARIISLGLSIAIAGCAKTDQKAKEPVKRSAYWQSSLTGKLTVPCVPDDTKVIAPDTPIIFREKCPKGWKQTMVYYKGPSRPAPPSPYQ